MAHVLVVGGASLLKEVAHFLAEQNNVVTIITHSQDDFQNLTATTPSESGKINPVLSAGKELVELKKVLEHSFQEFGPVNMALVWNTLNVAGFEDVVASFLQETSPICRLFHLEQEISSPQVAPSLWTSEAYDRVLYRKILFGFDFLPFADLPSRLEKKITEGVISGLKNDKRLHIIGNDEEQSQAQSA